MRAKDKLACIDLCLLAIQWGHYCGLLMPYLEETTLPPARQAAGPSSRAPEHTAPAPPGLHSTLPYSPGDQPGMASAQDDLRYYRPHTLLAGAGLGKAALGSGPGLYWVYDLGAYRTQGGAVDIGSDQSPDFFLRPPGRPLAWEPGTSGSSSGTNQGVARPAARSLRSGIGRTCAQHS